MFLEWQPISTIPKSEILILGLYGDTPVVIKFDAKLCDWVRNSDGLVLGTPNYWLPIPDPPQGNRQTVDEFIQSFQYGDEKDVPENCVATDLIYYAARKFNIALELNDDKLKRICPYCGR